MREMLTEWDVRLVVVDLDDEPNMFHQTLRNYLTRHARVVYKVKNGPDKRGIRIYALGEDLPGANSTGPASQANDA